MHIAMFAHYALPHTGGVETVVEALCRRLAVRHRVTLVTSAWGDAHGRVRDGARTTWFLPAIHASERFGVPYPVPTPGTVLRDALADVASADVFHVHGALYAQTVLGRRAARRAGRPLVLTEHVGRVPYPSAVLRGAQEAGWRLLGDDTLRRADGVVALNERVRDWLGARVPTCRPHCISNGVDLARFVTGGPAARSAARAALGLPVDAVLGLFVGRDAPKKNRAALLAAARSGWTLVLAGAPRSVREVGVIDLGLLAADRMPLLYHACDFLVHVADGEGFPMAVQEAMATGLPVALRWDPGYAATVSRDVVVAADDAALTVRAANGLAADAEARAATGARAQAWARARWSWEATVSAYEALYARGRTA